jgi:hypothetical protein
MNKIFIILFLFLTLNLSAQYVGHPNYINAPKKFQMSEPAKIILTYAGSIVLNAIGDGLNDSGHKGWGHTCNAVSLGIVLASPFYINYDKSKWYWYLASYCSLRIALFDYSYNTTRRLPFNYIGGTSTWDKMLKKLNPPETYGGRGVFLIFGISIPIKELK